MFVAAFALYANTFGHSWTFDDVPVITGNPDVRSWGEFLADSYPGRPLRELSFLLDHALFGLNPAGWRIQHILWHGVNAWLVFLLSFRLTSRLPVAWTASLLFLAHPIMVEVTANLSHRKDSLSLAFSLLSVLAYIRFTKDRKPLWLGMAVLMALVAFFGKENAVIIPGLWLGYEALFLPREQRFLLRFPKGVFALAGAGTIGILVWLFIGSGGSWFLGRAPKVMAKLNYFEPFTLWAYFRTVLKSWLFMFGKLVFPVDLAIEYTYPVPSSWLDPWVVLSLAWLALLIFLFFWGVRRAPALAFGLLWLGLLWLPVSNLYPLSYFAADRYLYAPSVGLFLAAAWGLERLIQSRRQLAVAVSLIILTCSYLTIQQNQVWKDDEALFTHAHAVSPDAAFALNNLGNIHLERGELLKAKEYYVRTVKLNPYVPEAQFNLALVHARLGNYKISSLYYENYQKLLQAGGGDK